MLPENHGVAFGVSASPNDSNKVFIWMDNRTDESQSYSLVCNVSYLSAFAVFDSEGNRLLTKAEEERRKSHPSGEVDISDVEICSCCIMMPIAPHSMQVVDHGDILAAYALSPGRYFFVPVNPNFSRTESLKNLEGQKIASLRKNAIEIVIPSVSSPK